MHEQTKRRRRTRRRLAGSCAALLALAGIASGCATTTATPAGATPAAADSGETPEGFVVMQVGTVMSGDQGHVVILTDASKSLFLPIGIGEAEARAILLRTERRRFERPLTHDLLDRVVTELGGRVVKIEVDGLKSSVFLATVTIARGDRRIRIDARPSDSIALAVGNGAPIFVSQEVVDRAGIKREDIEDKLREQKPTPEAGEDEPRPGITL